ncbi:amino acid ABC substrate-binding protein [Allostella vacuolata]|nr:amino acid ABC substrate-binding protein [Stella vacuolata]
MQGSFRRRFAAFAIAALGLCWTLPAFPQALPPLPDAIRAHRLLRVGIKCDYPPDGFLDPRGRPAGIEIDLARQIAAYAFGRADRIDMTCVTAANRIPFLLDGRIDLILATLSISDERARQIAFSAPYAWSASDLLVPRGSPLRTLDDLRDAVVIVTRGAWQADWFTRNLPGARQVEVETVAEGLQALLQGRGAAYAHDVPVLQGMARKNRGLRQLGQLYQVGFRGAAVRQGEAGWLAYVDAAIARARREGVIAASVRRYAEPGQASALLKSWDPSRAPAAAR